MVESPKFLNSELQKNFDQNGFVIIDFLDKETCIFLINEYINKSKIDSQADFSTTILEKDNSLKSYFNDLVCNTINNNIHIFCKTHIPLFGNYIVKKGPSNYMVGIHQDWSYVDESKYRSFNIWMSLVDSDHKNGGLIVLPKSHKLPIPIRYTPFDDSYFNPFKKLIKLKSKQLKLKAGQAVVYDSALIHFSNPNKSDKTRYACGGVCVPKLATPKHYYLKESTIYEYEVNQSFFNNFIPGTQPNVPIKKTFEAPRINKFMLLKSFMNIMFAKN